MHHRVGVAGVRRIGSAAIVAESHQHAERDAGVRGRRELRPPGCHVAHEVDDQRRQGRAGPIRGRRRRVGEFIVVFNIFLNSNQSYHS